ncbi:MAG TPA: hypothetical protein VIX84_00730, partial [Acidimicrobiales bacterium]
AEGRTVLVATNLMTEAEVLCDRLLLIDRGRPVFGGTVDEFRAAIRKEIVYRFLIEGQIERALELLPAAPGVHEAKCESVRAGVAEVVVTFDSKSNALPSVIRLLVDANVEIISCGKEDVSLDQVFRAMVVERPEALCAR